MKILTTFHHAHSIEGEKAYFHYYVPKSLKTIFGLRNNYTKREILFDKIMSKTLFGNQIFTEHLFRNFLKADNSVNIIICNLFNYQKIVDFIHEQDNGLSTIFDIEDLLEGTCAEDQLDEFKIEIVSSIPDRVTDC